MKNFFRDFRSSEQVAQETGLTVRRIQQLAPELIDRGIAAKFGRVIVYHKSAISFIDSLPETRGRKKLR